MPIESLNHINIKATGPLLDEVKSFYINIIGLREGPRPNISVKGYWLYAGDSAVVHLMDSAYYGDNGSQLTAGTSHLDHFAFTCSDIESVETRLKSLGVKFRRNDSNDYGFSQLFLQDPTGMGVELNFPHNQSALK